MGRRSHRKSRVSRRNKEGNFLEESCVGCHISHGDSDWILGSEELRGADLDYMLSSGLELTIDPEQRILSVVNVSSRYPRSFYISCYSINPEDTLSLFGKSPNELSKGRFSMEKNNVISHDLECVTFVLVLPPESIMDVCYIKRPYDLNDLVVDSDIQDLREPVSNPLPVPEIMPTFDIFPLQTNNAVNSMFCCSQGFGGMFTHFFPFTRHALDFSCPIGTPVVALADGEVISVQDHNYLSGIHVKNLFLWNSVMLKATVDEIELYIEYVHIRKGSSRVQKGEHVKRGQIICESGDVGFCPQPHLHLQVHRSPDPKALTVPFQFKLENGTLITPRAGAKLNMNLFRNPPIQ